MRDKLSNRRLWVIVLALAFALVPAIAFASHSFEDVPDSNVFHDDIEWMRDTGVTRGCNPPANTEYCPDRPLIRGEEAAFFHRYDGYLRDSLEPRLLPADCEAGERAEFDGEAWQCAPSGASAGLSAVAGEAVTVAATTTEELTVSCEEGQVAVASSVSPANPDLVVVSVIDGADVTISVTNNGADPLDVTPYAVCAEA